MNSPFFTPMLSRQQIPTKEQMELQQDMLKFQVWKHLYEQLFVMQSIESLKNPNNEELSEGSIQFISEKAARLADGAIAEILYRSEQLEERANKLAKGGDAT